MTLRYFLTAYLLGTFNVKSLFKEAQQLDEFAEILDPFEIEIAARFLMNLGRRFQPVLSQDWRNFEDEARVLLTKLKRKLK